jgi:hypothetical protein
MSDRAEYMREYKAQQRAEARASGLCGTCAKRKPKAGKANCEKCLQTRSAARRKSKRIARKKAK